MKEHTHIHTHAHVYIYFYVYHMLYLISLMMTLFNAENVHAHDLNCESTPALLRYCHN